jgi:hypothetical protein
MPGRLISGFLGVVCVFWVVILSVGLFWECFRAYFVGGLGGLA